MIPQIPEFQKTDDNKSILSNLKLLSRNWEELKLFLEALLPNLSDILSDEVIQSILDKINININQYKNILPIKGTQVVDSIVQIAGGTTNYSVKRIDDSTFQIFKSDDLSMNKWDTSPIIININRTDTGDVIYPIITKNVGSGSVPKGAGAFKITFNSPIDFDFTCVFI